MKTRISAEGAEATARRKHRRLRIAVKQLMEIREISS